MLRRPAFTLTLSALLLACAPDSGDSSRALAATAKSREAPLSDADFERYLAWRTANALPAVILRPGGPAPSTPGGSRIGGPVWLKQGEDWPKGKNGKPMTFLAQVDFSTLPRIPDYPESGILQFFIARDDLFGADLDRPEAGDFKVIWRETIEGPGGMQHGPFAGRQGIDDYSPLYERTVQAGVALTGVAQPHYPDPGTWPFYRDLPDIAQNDPTNRVFDFEDAQRAGKRDEHHIGGHPGFTQSDYRERGAYADVDRVLLQLWSDDTVMWGDMGQGQFTIRRADLLKRDFSKVLYQWDCY